MSLLLANQGAPEAQTLTAQSIASAEALGAAIASLRLTASAIASSEQQGQAALRQALSATGVPSAGAIGAGSIGAFVPSIGLSATGLVSAERSGLASIGQALTGAGGESEETFGAASMAAETPPPPDAGDPGFSLFAARGTPAQPRAQTLRAWGIASAEATGRAQIGLPALLMASGSPSAEAIGRARLTIDPPLTMLWLLGALDDEEWMVLSEAGA